MFSLMEFKRTGRWPSNILNNVSDNQLEPIITTLTEEYKQQIVETSVKGESTSYSTLISNNNLFDNLSFDSIFNQFIHFFKPVYVEGYLNNLLGQQLFIY